MNLENNLREIRIKRGLSNLQLARVTGIAPCFITNIEKGRQYVYPGWKRRLSEALNVSISELFPQEVTNDKM